MYLVHQSIPAVRQRSRISIRNSNSSSTHTHTKTAKITRNTQSQSSSSSFHWKSRASLMFPKVHTSKAITYSQRIIFIIIIIISGISISIMNSRNVNEQRKKERKLKTSPLSLPRNCFFCSSQIKLKASIIADKATANERILIK